MTGTVDGEEGGRWPMGHGPKEAASPPDPAVVLASLAFSFLLYHSVVALFVHAFRLGESGTARSAYLAYCLVLAPMLAVGAALLARGQGGLRGIGSFSMEERRLWGLGLMGGLLGAAGNLLLFLAVSSGSRLIQGRHLQPTDVATLRHLRGPWLLLAFLSACLVAPFCEELFFRGVLYSSMRRSWGRAAATLISSAVFSLLHLKWEGIPSLFFLGLLFVFLYERSGSLLPGMLAHSLNNILALAIMLSL